MNLSADTLKQLRLTMKSLGCVETTSDRMDEGNLRFNDPTLDGTVDYVIYTRRGIVRRVTGSGWGRYFTPLNPSKMVEKVGEYPTRPRAIDPAKSPAELVLLAVRGVINYRNTIERREDAWTNRV